MPEKATEKVVTRFAPSPTGLPHFGTAMYALLNYLYARQNNGEVIMRSEDTDPVRSKKEYENAIKEGLAWIGITPDKFFRQSERTDIYKKYIAKMIEEGTTYVSTETNEEGKTRDLVRFRNPNKVVTFHDESRGDISVDTTDLKDFIIARDVDSPLYHLTVVVDDHETGVTHVIRGEDGLANTPRQILIQEAIGAARPVYAHYPFVIMPNRAKMGKRNGAISLQDYRAKGYLPEALVNFIILMAWHPKDDRELFTIDELIKEFELKRIGKGGAMLDEKKLDWLNREYIKKLTPQELEKSILEWLPERMQDKIIAPKLVPVIREYISKWGDVKDMAERGELDFFFKAPKIKKEKLAYKNCTPEKTSLNLQLAVKALENLEESQFKAEDIKINLMLIADNLEKRGELLHPVRYALSGLEKSPDPFVIASIIGKNETLSRLQKAI
jgi:glutamyl-tRNA synthetase